MLSAANQFSLSNFVCLQRISFSLLNCVVCSESVFAAELCCHQQIGFRCRIVESAVNQFSLPHCGVNNKSFPLSSCGVSSESVFAAEL